MNAEGSAWGSAYRLVAAQKWRRQSAAMGGDVTRAIVQLAAAQPGMRVLDLACGTGEPSISLTEKVGTNGQVTGIDLNPELLEVARERAAQRGLENASFQQADAHALPFADESFDLVTSRLGVMFFSDAVSALREAHRVLRPGGRIALLAWGPFEQPYFLTTIAIVQRHVPHPAVRPGEANMFRFSQAGSLSEALGLAGFHDLDEHAATVPWSWPGPPEEVWQYFREVTVPFRPLLNAIPEEKAEQVHAEVVAAIRRYYDGKRVNFTANMVLASAVK